MTWKKSPTSRWNTATGVPKISGKARAITTSARTSKRCCDTGSEAWQQDFLKLDLPDRHFDGVFANAALFHVPSQELPRVLLQMHAALKPRGVLFASNPHGHNEEGWNRGRYGVYHDLENRRRTLSAAGFVELTHSITARPGCRAYSSPGWRASGADRNPEDREKQRPQR